MKTFEEFVKDVEACEELKAKFEAAMVGVKTAEEKAAVIMKLAKENGYDMSVEDLSGLAGGKQKLDDEALQLVSGGEHEWCPGSYECWALQASCGHAFHPNSKPAEIRG